MIIRLFFLALFFVGLGLRADDGVAIGIVYDTSGSMAHEVTGSGGKREAKFLVANRALEAAIGRLEKFAATGQRKVFTGLYRFNQSGMQGEVAVPIGPFQAAPFRAWLAAFQKPVGGTPIGRSLALAGGDLLKMKADARHVLVITDGENTMGQKPEVEMDALQIRALKEGKPIYFHFIAFDVKAQIFEPVKKLGATLVSASDEKDLNDKLAFIIEEKILLEKE